MEHASSNRRPSARATALAAAAACLCLGAGGSEARELRARTPAELVATLGTLERAERYGEILERIEPEQRDAYLWVAWFGIVHDAPRGGPDAAADLRAIVAEHGLDEELLSRDVSQRGALRRLAAEAFRRVDRAELLADLARFRVEHGRSGVAFGFAGKLRELHVEDDWALARVGRSEFQLVRARGAWSWRPFEDLDA